MAEKKFIPVKVTDREWAEKLLDGEVFMRPLYEFCLLYTSPSPRDTERSRMPSSA